MVQILSFVHFASQKNPDRNPTSHATLIGFLEELHIFSTCHGDCGRLKDRKVDTNGGGLQWKVDFAKD